MTAVAKKPGMSKRAQAISEQVDVNCGYSLLDALALLQKVSSVKFNESVELAVNLGIDARKSDQAVRGSVVLPQGTGKNVRVAVLADGEAGEAAKQAGADLVGIDELITDIQAGKLDFDVLIATPQTMPKIAKLGQILGPRGLMPNPKVGTVNADTAVAVKNAKAGQVRFRADKAGIVHCLVGKLNFDTQAIGENVAAVLTELKRIKPSSAKGVYIKKITLSSTMGPGLAVDVASI